MEECKRNDDDPNILEVKCTYCGSFFVPTCSQVGARIRAINDSTGRENHFYCLDKDCKKQCSIFGQKTWPKGFKFRDNRPYIDPYWREEVLKRANHKCEICGSEDNLNAHHIQSATLNPMLANDVDNGICVCEQCHYQLIHSQPGCTTYDLRCNNQLTGITG